MDPLHAVKWHPQQPDLVAVASETNVYLLNIADAAHVFEGSPLLTPLQPLLECRTLVEPAFQKRL